MQRSELAGNAQLNFLSLITRPDNIDYLSSFLSVFAVFTGRDKQTWKQGLYSSGLNGHFVFELHSLACHSHTETKVPRPSALLRNSVSRSVNPLSCFLFHH